MPPDSEIASLDNASRRLATVGSYDSGKPSLSRASKWKPSTESSASSSNWTIS